MAEQDLQPLTLEEYEQQLRAQAQAGDPTACFTLVDHFERKAPAANMLEAQHRINYLIEASNKGVGAASVLLGTWYLTGHYVAKDIAQAILFFEHAGNTGKDPAGFYRLAELFDQGTYLPINRKKSEDYLKKAVAAGHVDAIFTYATKILATDINQAFKLLQENYQNKGHVRSLFFLKDDGRFNQSKVEKIIQANSKNEPYAAALYAARLFDANQKEQAQPFIEFAKQNNNPIGYYLSALILLEQEQFEQAHQHMLIAANLGHIEAAYRSGLVISQQLDQITDPAVQQQLVSQMVQLFAQAAQGGFAPAQFSLAQCWLQGIGVEKNQQEAMSWLDRAAQQGHIEAIFALAINLPSDHEQHLPLLKVAAEAGHTKAMLCIGMYLQNNQQADQAIAIFNQAKAANDLRADYLLGMAYLNGVGVEADAKQAVEFFKLSSENNDSDAHFALYEAYKDGVGVRRNKKSQAKYLKLAQVAGHPKALDLTE